MESKPMSPATRPRPRALSRAATAPAPATALSDTVSPPGTHDEPFVTVQGDSPAHAAGHRHLTPPRSARRHACRTAHGNAGRPVPITPVIRRGPEHDEIQIVDRDPGAILLAQPTGDDGRRANLMLK